MRSIFLDYYIGSFLLWKGNNKNFNDLACENIYGYSGAEKPSRDASEIARKEGEAAILWFQEVLKK